MYDLEQFLEPVNPNVLNGDVPFYDRQFGRTIDIFSETFPDVDKADVIIAGIDEFRGAGFFSDLNPADEVRTQLYKLLHWHQDISVADIGNIKTGATLNDSYSCVTTVLKDFVNTGKSVILIGGSHDLTLAQYKVYSSENQFAESAVIDSHIDLQSESSVKSENFLMDMLTSEPNFIRYYNHIGFQSYFVHPYMLETMDKLRFDCMRVGIAREKMDEIEPLMRQSDFISFDLNAVRYSDAPAGGISPNGFTGEEACSLSRFAGSGEKTDSFGIYGYRPEKDTNHITALQIAQMIWYFIDGKSRSKQESALHDKQNFNEFHTPLNGEETVFLQSKKTGRWWMQIGGKKMISCSYNDYVYASNNEIPERWLRAQERDF